MCFIHNGKINIPPLFVLGAVRHLKDFRVRCLIEDETLVSLRVQISRIIELPHQINGIVDDATLCLIV